MSRLFLFLFESFQRKRKLFFVLLILLSGSLAYFSSRVELAQDLARLMPRNSGMGKAQDIFQRSAAFDKLVIHMYEKDTTASNPSDLENFADKLTEHLKRDCTISQCVKEIRLKLPEDLAQRTYEIQNQHLALFLEEEDYAKIEAKLGKEAIKTSLQAGIRLMSMPSAGPMREFFLSDPLFLTPIALEKLARLQNEESFGMKNGYLESKDGRSLLIIIKPSIAANDINANTIFIQRLDEILSLYQNDKNVGVDYFGASAVAVCNAVQVKKDIYLTMSIALALITLLIWGYFRQLSLTVIILLPAVFGILFAMTIIWFLKGSISGIALGAGAVVLGIAIDYSLHFFTHLKHTGSVRTTLKDISTPMLIGNISTVGAFVSLLFIDSEVLNDFGFFSALSLLGGAIFTLVFLPQIAKATHSSSIPTSGWMDRLVDRFGHFKPENNKWIIWSGILITIVMAFYYPHVKFQSDLSALNFMSPELKQAEERLYKKASQSERTIFVVYAGKDLQEALRATESGALVTNELQKNGTIKSANNVGFLMPSDSLQTVKIKRWQQFWTPEKQAQFENDFTQAASELGLKPEAFTSFLESIEQTPSLMDDSSRAFINRTFLSDFIKKEESGAVSIMSSIKVPKANTLKVSEYISAHTQAVVIDKQFIATRLLSVVSDNFNQILLSCSLMVFLVLLISYGRIELTLITFIPMLISWVWILGFMALFGIGFNIVNIIISTFIFGLGDDYSIFMMEGLQDEYATGKKNLTSYKTAILLSMLSTLIGVGVLIFAEHPALKSIALISVVGIICVMCIAYLFIPLLFKLFITNRLAKGLPPLTFFGLTRSIFAFLYFTLGCIILTVSGVLLFKIFRIKSKQVKYYYHVAIMLMARSLVYIMYMVKKQIINPSKEDFSKPAVVIANHQSFLDILSIIMLRPKLIFLTNEWVWNSPVMWQVVRLADFYSVDGGENVEDKLDFFRSKVEDGYSIVIFPEGTRSEDGVIKRFHKGAFYLAETLQLDILPVLLHGTGMCMNKRDFMLSKGTLTLRVLPRIAFDSSKTYQENAKECTKLLRSEYQRHSKPSFFYYQLIQRYLYKGPVLEWYSRIKVGLENSYELFDQHLPSNGKIYDLGCGYGFLAQMLTWTRPAREFVGIDYDASKIEVAENIKKQANGFPQFIPSDILAFDLAPCEGIILADVLHYLSPTNQEVLIAKCLAALKPGGIFLLRDGDASLAPKQHERTKLSELFSTKLLGFNKTGAENLSFIDFTVLIEKLKQYENIQVERIEESKKTSNTVLKITKLY
jgi:uncharacterized protein